MVFEHVHISKGVSKLGANIPSVSLPPGVTCRPDSPCYAKCYARKGRFSFPKIKSLIQTNLDIWNADPVSFERDVQIAAFSVRFFRWHVAGDIPDTKYFEMMVRIAKSLPDTRFLAFTKQFEIVNNYLSHANLPSNLTIVLSAWGDFVPENPHNLPVAYVRLKKKSQTFPPFARQCGGYCGKCVMTEESNCWNLKPGQAVVFEEH